MDAALDAGINLFDTSDIYGNRGRSEELLGAALARPARRGGDRHQVRHATWPARTARTGAPAAPAATSVRAVEASLRRLRHRLDRPLPDAPARPGHPDRGDARRAGRPGARAGKVRYLGRSNFAGWQVADADLDRAHAAASTPFVCAQNEYSLLHRERRGRAGAGLRALRPRLAAVLPARQRPAHRQVPAGRGAPPTAPGSPARTTARLADATWDAIEALSAFAAERGR